MIYTKINAQHNRSFVTQQHGIKNPGLQKEEQNGYEHNDADQRELVPPC